MHITIVLKYIFVRKGAQAPQVNFSMFYISSLTIYDISQYLINTIYLKDTPLLNLSYW